MSNSNRNSANDSRIKTRDCTYGMSLCLWGQACSSSLGSQDFQHSTTGFHSASERLYWITPCQLGWGGMRQLGLETLSLNWKLLNCKQEAPPLKMTDSQEVTSVDRE